MKLANTRENYQFCTSKASEIVRNLGLLGFALIWVFKGVDADDKIGFHRDLIFGAFFLVLSLSFDFLQYVYGSIAWGVLNRRRELKKLDEKKNFLVPAWINWPSNFFFWFKLLFIVLGYFFILKFLGYNTYVY